MRIGMRRFSQMVFAVVVVGGSSLVFQNCGSYAPAGIDGSSSLEPLCTGSSCLTNPESILLAIGNADPERLIPSDTAFDIGGYCDPAGYAGNRIYYQIQGPTPTQPQVVDNGCDELGRFRIRVALPANYDHGSIHSLVVQMRAVDEAGAEVENPLSLNRKTINIVTNLPPAGAALAR